jgi:hypothetical protein
MGVLNYFVLLLVHLYMIKNNKDINRYLVKLKNQLEKELNIAKEY